MSDTAFALVLVVCAAEPSRVGEAIVVDDSWGDAGRVFGRGEARDDDGAERAWLVRQRPGGAAPCVALDDDYVSRKQLAIGWHVDGVSVENVGRLAMRVGTAKVTRAVVRPGETLEIDGQLLFVCVERPLTMPLGAYGERCDFGTPDAHGFVGESAAAWALRDRVAFVGARAGHVLLLGPSGSGAEVVAQAIHARSARASRRLVARNAAALPPGLVDAELFGNVASYPIPGLAERPGAIGEADGGTLFIDEIGELAESSHARLLRVLDDGGEYQRLGDAHRRSSSFRLVAATNRPIEQLTSDVAARFPLRVHLAGLEERPEDVPLLVRAIARRLAANDPAIGERFLDGVDAKRGEPRVAIDLMRALVTHRWTTHLRELEALLWASLASSEGRRADLTDEVKRQLARAASAVVTMPAVPASIAPPAPGAAARQSRPPAEITADEIRASLAKHGGVEDRVWRELGLGSRFALQRLMQKLHVTDDEIDG